MDNITEDKELGQIEKYIKSENNSSNPWKSNFHENIKIKRGRWIDLGDKINWEYVWMIIRIIIWIISYFRLIILKGTGLHLLDEIILLQLSIWFTLLCIISCFVGSLIRIIVLSICRAVKGENIIDKKMKNIYKSLWIWFIFMVLSFLVRKLQIINCDSGWTIPLCWPS